MEPKIIKLKDGRKLAYAEYGNSDGVPLILLHGSPTTHLWPPSLVERAEKSEIRLIMPVRPGYGRSDPKSGCTMVNRIDDIVELADFLLLERFGVLGVSGGGPYALACGSKISHRLAGLGVVASSAPPSDENFKPRLSLSDLDIQNQPYAERAVNDTEGLADEWISGASEVDRPIMTQWRSWLVATLREAFRQGVRGYSDDIDAFYFKSWGFSLGEIRTRVYLWHGEEDNPATSAHILASNIPDCVATYLPGVGHFLNDEHWDDIYMTMRKVMESA